MRDMTSCANLSSGDRPNSLLRRPTPRPQLLVVLVKLLKVIHPQPVLNLLLLLQQSPLWPAIENLIRAL
jgi:hypothetical protein